MNRPSQVFVWIVQLHMSPDKQGTTYIYIYIKTAVVGTIFYFDLLSENLKSAYSLQTVT